MMHSFFYRFFSCHGFRDSMWPLLGAFGAGSILGCASFAAVPAGELEHLCYSLLNGTPQLLPQVLCGLLPLLLAGGVCFLCPWRPAWLLPVAFSGLLLSFSVCVLVGGSNAGWLLAVLLMMGRCATLPLLFWFLLRRMELGKARFSGDFAFACCLCLALNLVIIWLLSPALTELSQFVFI